MAAGGISLRIPATLESLGLVQDFVGSHAKGLGLGADLAGRLELVVEELVVNIGSYAYPGGEGDMEVDCVLGPDANRFCLILRDWGAAFDPLDRAAPDIEGGLDEREPGGLGIFLVREMADECTYHRNGDMNEFRACFALPREEQA
jgi:anti-sigma regulatory factor (Ser/Thr protein kinase)